MRWTARQYARSISPCPIMRSVSSRQNQAAESDADESLRLIDELKSNLIFGSRTISDTSKRYRHLDVHGPQVGCGPWSRLCNSTKSSRHSRNTEMSRRRLTS